jgi:hypothetical protein
MSLNVLPIGLLSYLNSGVVNLNLKYGKTVKEEDFILGNMIYKF